MPGGLECVTGSTVQNAFIFPIRHTGGSCFWVVQRSHTLLTFPEKSLSPYWIFTGIVGHNPAGGSWAHLPAPGGALLAALWHNSICISYTQRALTLQRLPQVSRDENE